MGETDRYQNEREWMVKNTIAARGVHDKRVLDAISRLPRQLFVPEDERDESYADRPLPIGCGQTIALTATFR